MLESTTYIKHWLIFNRFIVLHNCYKHAICICFVSLLKGEYSKILLLVPNPGGPVTFELAAPTLIPHTYNSYSKSKFIFIQVSRVILRKILRHWPFVLNIDDLPCRYQRLNTYMKWKQPLQYFFCCLHKVYIITFLLHRHVFPHC